MVRILKERGHWQGELINKRKDGEKFPTWYSISQVLNADGQPENYIAIFSDISERKKSRERIDFLAHHDSLTELPNRALLNDRLEMAINTAKRRGEKVGVLFIDLDRFKNINDSLGHAAGDQILRQTAARLSAAVRTNDTVARLGGDEFVVLLPRVRNERTGGYAAALERLLREEVAAFQRQVQSWRVTPERLSLGATIAGVTRTQHRFDALTAEHMRAGGSWKWSPARVITPSRCLPAVE